MAQNLKKNLILFLSRKAAVVIAHEKYNPLYRLRYDILLLKTDKPFILNNDVHPIHMVEAGYVPRGKQDWGGFHKLMYQANAIRGSKSNRQ